jgi:RimJ/RimL family protein N-acetyltransferase
MLNIRPATKADSKVLWEWANDQQTREASFNSQQITWKEHIEWFESKMHDANCHLYIITDESSEPIGQIRYDLQTPDTAVVSISLARDMRNRGYGTKALIFSLRQFSKDVNVQQVIAYIKPQNTPSIRAFEKAGFAESGECEMNGQSALRFSWRRSKNGNQNTPWRRRYE